MAKITYRDNPFNSKAELTVDDIKRLTDNVEKEELWESIFSAKRHLKSGEDYSPTQALYYLEMKDIYAEIESHLSYYLESFNFSHCGDCTCIPSSCERCQAESHIGIDTIKGIDKYSGNNIQNLFKENITIDEAIEKLKSQMLVKHKDRVDYEDWWDGNIESWEYTEAQTLSALLVHRDRLVTQNELNI